MSNIGREVIEQQEKDDETFIKEVQDLLDKCPEYQAMSESIDISKNDPVLEGF